MVAHYLEHFEPTSLSLSKEVNFSGERSFYPLGTYSRFNKYLLQCKAGKFALRLLEARLLLVLKWETAARKALPRAHDVVCGCSRGCGISGGHRGADTGH